LGILGERICFGPLDGETRGWMRLNLGTGVWRARALSSVKVESVEISRPRHHRESNEKCAHSLDCVNLRYSRLERFNQLVIIFNFIYWEILCCFSLYHSPFTFLFYYNKCDYVSTYFCSHLLNYFFSARFLNFYIKFTKQKNFFISQIVIFFN